MRVCAVLTGSYLEVPAVLILPTCVGQVGKVARIRKSGEAGGAESLGGANLCFVFKNTVDICLHTMKQYKSGHHIKGTPSIFSPSPPAHRRFIVRQLLPGQEGPQVVELQVCCKSSRRPARQDHFRSLPEPVVCCLICCFVFKWLLRPLKRAKVS